MMLAIIKCVFRCHKVTSGSITLGLDEKQSMKQASRQSLFPTHILFDLLVNIRSKITKFPIKVYFFLVERHQLKSHGQQSCMGEINDKCDLLTKIYSA